MDAMNRIERLTGILMLLQEKPRTSEEIARHFEVSKRTILRDVQALSELGVPVIAREGAGGGYALPDDFFLAPLPLSAHEAFLLLLALSVITRLPDAPFPRERATLAAKLRAALPQADLPAAEDMLAAVRIDIPQREARAPFLDALIAAAKEERWLRVTYRSRERHSTQHLLPFEVAMEGGFWYCRAYSYEREERRTYRVDRILSVEPVDAVLPGIVLPDPIPYDDPSHPEIEAALTPRGVFAVELEKHLASSIQRAVDGSGRLAFRCPPSELDWFARYFASLGDEVTVLGPPELRARLRDLGKALAARYGE
jgi:predicted DNA-binding transcriptional regulator YafY